jgi:hypothetical protein
MVSGEARLILSAVNPLVSTKSLHEIDGEYPRMDNLFIRHTKVSARVYSQALTGKVPL